MGLSSVFADLGLDADVLADCALKAESYDACQPPSLMESLLANLTPAQQDEWFADLMSDSRSQGSLMRQARPQSAQGG